MPDNPQDCGRLSRVGCSFRRRGYSGSPAAWVAFVSGPLSRVSGSLALALAGGAVTLVGYPVAHIGGPLTGVGDMVAIVGGPVALVGDAVALVGGPLALGEIVVGPVQRGGAPGQPGLEPSCR
jgi:hypothetical protein